MVKGVQGIVPVVAALAGIAASAQLAVEQKYLARFPGGDFFAGDGVEVDAARSRHVVGQLGPRIERWRIEKDGAGAIEHDVRVARGGAVGDHGDGKIGRVRGRVDNFDVENCS